MKIGRHEYEIIIGDKFLDNGCVIQLITQSKEKSKFGHKPNPILSKRAVQELKNNYEIELYRYGETNATIIKVIGFIYKKTETI